MPFLRGKAKKRMSQVGVKQFVNGKMVKKYNSFPSCNCQEKSSSNNCKKEYEASSSSIIAADHTSTYDQVNFISDNKQKNEKNVYHKLKEKEIISWENSNMISVFAKKFELLSKMCCVVCQVFCVETYWCQTCGEYCVYCNSCLQSVHLDKPLHKIMLLKDHHLIPYCYKRRIINPHTESCSTVYYRNVSVITESANVIQCEIAFCQCNSEFETLLVNNLWPSTPIKPSTVISVDLLYKFVALQLEGKISLLSFCDALSLQSGFPDYLLKRCLYRFLQTDSIDQFRKFRTELLQLRETMKGYNGLGKCSACPKDCGDLFYCIDANFGLVLKKSASKTENVPRSYEKFVPDGAIKNFLENYDDSKSENKECNNFQAGNSIRAKRKTNKLSVTGVIGASCRHEVPKIFLNMFHGERLGYVVYILEKLQEETLNKDVNINIIYDIACILKQHLMRKKMLDQYPNFKFAIPAFHSYGHKPECQILHSVRRTKSFGLMDGELMERLWSYLRPFSKITKEMTPGHRVDLLTDALYHFGSIKMVNIGKTLIALQEKAINIQKSSQMEIAALTAKLEYEVNEDTFDLWKKQQEDIAKQKTSQAKSDGCKWQDEYYMALNQYYKEKALLLMTSNVTDAANHDTKIRKLEKNIKCIEKEHSIVKRWSALHPMYRDCQKRELELNSLNIHDAISGRKSEREFLLVLKKRYADGSSVANRLSKQINKTCVQLRNLIASYNGVKREMSPSHIDVTYEDVIKADHNIFSNTAMESSKNQYKATIIDYYIRKNRATEEIVLIENEMNNVINYWQEQCIIIKRALAEKENTGLEFIINERYVYAKFLLKSFKKLFNDTIPKEDSFNEEDSSNGEEEMEEDIDDYVEICVSESDEDSYISSDEEKI